MPSPPTPFDPPFDKLRTGFDPLRPPSTLRRGSGLRTGFDWLRAQDRLRRGSGLRTGFGGAQGSGQASPRTGEGRRQML